MCLVVFAIGASARWPLVIAANRDEFLERPTLPLARWKTASGQEILSGRDLRAGGTWMGITPGGRIAFLTNVRQAQPEAAPRSRGELVTRWLEGASDAADFAAALEDQGAAFGGFNLVLGDLRQKAWTWVTNKYQGAPALHAQALAPGLYGLSNAGLDTPWPKTTELKRVLTAALQTGDGHEGLQKLLWTALGNRQRALPAELPHTGVPPDLEEALSSAFVEVPGRAYGTRCSTVLLATALGHGWNIEVEERTHGSGDAAPAHRQQLNWQPSTTT